MPPLVRLAVLVLIAPTLAPAQSATKPAPARGGSSPEDAVALMAKSAKAGDLDATFGVLVDEQSRPILAWFRTQAEVASAINAYVDAADAAFGKAPDARPRRVDFDLKRDLAASFEGMNAVGTPTTVDADHATLRIKNTFKAPDGKVISREEPAKARKTASGWKLSLDSFEGADFAGGAKFLAEVRDGFDRATKLVKAGKIKSRDEAMKEIGRDQPKNIPGNVPMPRFLTGPG